MACNFVTNPITYISYTGFKYLRQAALKIYVSVPYNFLLCIFALTARAKANKAATTNN